MIKILSFSERKIIYRLDQCIKTKKVQRDVYQNSLLSCTSRFTGPLQTVT